MQVSTSKTKISVWDQQRDIAWDDHPLVKTKKNFMKNQIERKARSKSHLKFMKSAGRKQSVSVQGCQKEVLRLKQGIHLHTFESNQSNWHVYQLGNLSIKHKDNRKWFIFMRSFSYVHLPFYPCSKMTHQAQPKSSPSTLCIRLHLTLSSKILACFLSTNKNGRKIWI